MVCGTGETEVAAVTSTWREAHTRKRAYVLWHGGASRVCLCPFLCACECMRAEMEGAGQRVVLRAPMEVNKERETEGERGGDDEGIGVSSRTREKEGA